MGDSETEWHMPFDIDFGRLPLAELGLDGEEEETGVLPDFTDLWSL